MTAVADNGNGTLTFTYANGQTYITPTLSGIQGPIGPAGPQGPQGAQGVQGPTGATGLTGPQGPAGPAGAQGPQGIAGTNGTNGTNGANGQNTLVKATTEISGANCATGGVKIEYGLDSNNNGTLDVSEINVILTKYVCNGAVGATGPQGAQGSIGEIGPAGTQGPQGVQGPAGTTGTNGLNALIKTTTEPAGANCANGGTKIETGLDANGNGVLDLEEINSNSTSFICSNSIQTTSSNLYSQMIAFSSSTSWVCPAVVDSVEIEIYGASGGGGGGAFSVLTATALGCVGNGKGGVGGKGGYTRQKIAVQSGLTYNIVIGSGGVGGASSNVTCVGVSNGGNGGNGGVTSFNNEIIVPGGTGGQGGACSYVAANGTNGQVINFVSGNSNFIPSSYPTTFTDYLYGVYNRPNVLSGGNGSNGAMGAGNCNACSNCSSGTSGNKGLIIIRL
jgi:hypothetical protein